MPNLQIYWSENYYKIIIFMEFLLIWVLNTDIIDSGLRYNDAGECYASAQNIGKDLQYVGISPPNFTCIPIKKGKELTIFLRNESGTRFPF